MFVHSVYFWLKKDLDEDQLAAFRAGLESLRSVETVQHLFIGAPVHSSRPVVDTSYTLGLVVVFKDQGDQDAYQVHPLHKRFLDSFGGQWDRIAIYDFQ